MIINNLINCPKLKHSCRKNALKIKNEEKKMNSCLEKELLLSLNVLQISTFLCYGIDQTFNSFMQTQKNCTPVVQV